MKTLWELFATFFKMGAVTFGGGLAMLPILKREVVSVKNWATEDELINYYAVGQCTPGIIAVNTATFIGYKKRGLIGAVASTFGVVCPSLIIILCIASFIKNFSEYEIVEHIFNGIKIAVAALITEAVISLFKKSVKSKFGIILFLSSILLNIYLNLSPIYIVIIIIIIGILQCLSKEKHLRGDKK